MNRSVFKLTKLMFWVICIIFTGASEINATHIMGMDLTYKCRGNNQYEIYLTFYRDCNGIPVDSLPIVNWSAVCGSGSIPLQLTNMTEITPTCPGVTGSACNNGNGQYGIEEYSFQGIVTLPNGCTNIELNYFKCCRNGAFTTLQNPLTYGTYVETLISDVTDCNHSPEFTNKPVPFICVGQPVLYNHGAIDIDGDQLSYSLVDCLTDNALPVPYNAGFSTSNPLSTTNGFTLDPVTGAISFTASTTQVGVICVLVEEFRNGVKVGEVVRDIQFTAVNCSFTLTARIKLITSVLASMTLASSSVCNAETLPMVLFTATLLYNLKGTKSVKPKSG